MPTKEEMTVVEKAVIYDLMDILDKNPDKTYTVDEIKQLMKAYITRTEQG
jgi:predicted metal-dependent enzyme (double-stranded beta helix superfamily)